jgi:hypothetical protein
MKRALIAAFAILVVAAGTTPAMARKPSPKPTVTPQQSVPQPVVAPGYYIMQGSVIVSPRYATVPDCYKALAALKNTLQPGTDSIACVHRE